LDRESLKASMENTYSALTIEPVEAGYELGGGATPSVSVTPGREGRRIEEETFFSELEAGLFEGDHEYAVPLSSARPELTTARAERLKPTNLLLLPHQLRGRA
ncbi:MAG TPA: peptidoglycan binding domain-containing protein, partial [Rubrobacter sp.]|nr:peptidoglycan binding domain-containing protein [Rubrobacter sp.]